MRLNGIDSDGAYYGKIDSMFRADNKLGGTKGFLHLQEQEDIQIYPEMEITAFTKSGNGVWTFLDAATNVLRDTVKSYPFKLASGMPNDELASRYLIKAYRIPSITQSLTESLNKVGVTNVSASGLGYAAYSDYSRSHTTRIEQTAAHLQKAAEQLSGRGGLMLEAPVATQMPYAQALIHIPTESSHYNLTDHDVPFLQMVLSGQVAYAASDINLEGNRVNTLLRSIETGSALSFSLMWEEYSKVADTAVNFLYASTYKTQKDSIMELYKQSRQALQDVYGLPIVDYQIMNDNLRAVTYANKTTILINYGEQAVQWQQQTVKAHSYSIIKGDVAT
jgi:hypothetical protein